MSAARSTKRVATPVPGRPVRGSTTGRPIMALLDLLGRRWVQRIIWELRGEALSFRALRAACDDVSPSVLNARLADLRTAGLVELTDAGYCLTADGQSLLRLMLPLHDWAERWARRWR
ncbi:helix-turn-helix domain-containing protein [Reyranella sp. CPCC 100927]|uniref:winged helix-turn-helix transcriptional regulator n=1 Tax=Reyranella sp. CPCC 100927 TaxID=2599616 RepID=UPI0011B3A6A0|nr:helix-turn-helix domain-containing protein [Reyranella sp. CPCC 100927]TWT15656.1 helix-turn-helix transcriptional regulator [Reyranella sp. CPCC 100927]